VTGICLAPIVIVALQALWLQPLLDHRARYYLPPSFASFQYHLTRLLTSCRMFIKGTPPPQSQSWQHHVYILLELAKVHALAFVPFLFPPFSGLVGL
jgi:hypothetical protein